MTESINILPIKWEHSNASIFFYPEADMNVLVQIQINLELNIFACLFIRLLNVNNYFL